MYCVLSVVSILGRYCRNQVLPQPACTHPVFAIYEKDGEGGDAWEAGV